MAKTTSEVFAECAGDGDVARFIEFFDATIQTAGVAKTRDALRNAGGIAGSKMGVFALQCLRDLAVKKKPDFHAVNILVNLGPTGDPQDGTSPAEELACYLIRSEDANLLKIATRVLVVWGAKPDGNNLKPATRQLLSVTMLRLAKSKGAPRVASALADMPGFLDVPGRWHVLVAAEDQGHEEVVESLAKVLSTDEQINLVNYRLGNAHLKSVARVVRKLGLEAVYPDSDYNWRVEEMRIAVSNDQANPVCRIAWWEPRLRLRAVENLVKLGEPAMAVEFASQWKVDLPPGAEEAASKQWRENEKINVSVPSHTTLRIVSSTTTLTLTTFTLADAREHIFAASVVGFAVETCCMDDSVPSLLQIALHDIAFIFDLQDLSNNVTFVKLIENLMKARHITKVGIGVYAAMAALVKGCPMFASCTPAVRLVEIGDEVAQQRIRAEGISKTMAIEGTMCVTGMTERYLGKPFDKNVHVIDWNRRPITDLLKRHAALEAIVPLQIYMSIIGTSAVA